MEKAHSPRYEKDGRSVSSPNNNCINSPITMKSSLNEERCQTKSPQYPLYSSSSIPNGNGINNKLSLSISSSSPTGQGQSSPVPLTKNVGVGANLNLSSSASIDRRHSSAHVNVGRGHLGSINGPSSVSISTGLNSCSNGSINLSTNGSVNNNNNNSSGSVSNSSNGSGGGRIAKDRESSSTRHSSRSSSPGLIPSSILPELLQQTTAELAVASTSNAATIAACASVSLGSSSHSNSRAIITSSSSNINNIPPPGSTTKVGATSPAKQGILGRHQRGEMINGSTSSSGSNTTLNPNNNPSAAPVASKIVSQNVNGTLEMTSIPTNESELQLFRVLQRANLLSYFDVMIELGGDDVQQLCEAGEEEFLEIMALIGMASKPLHVRRLQKALQEWMSNPTLFQSPVLPPGVMPLNASSNGRSSTGLSSVSPPVTVPSQIPTIPTTTITPPSSSFGGSIMTSSISSSGPTLPIRPIPGYHSVPSAAAAMAAAAAAAQQAMFLTPSEMKSFQNKLQVMTNGHHLLGTNGSAGNSPNSGSEHSTATNLSVRTAHASPTSPGGNLGGGASTTSYSNGYHHHPPRHGHHNDRHNHEISRERDAYFKEKAEHLIHHVANGVRIPVDQINPSHFLEQRIRTGSEPNSPAASESASESGSSLSPVPFLQESEIIKLSDAAIQIVKSLPPYVFELPKMPPKRKFFGDFELIMRLSPNDPRRADEIRKASTIYGRPDPSLGNIAASKSRKFPKPLSMHEVCVNEAAAQLCKHVPALVTRRDELFALAKQVVRDAALPYSNNNNFSISLIHNNNNNNFTNANHNLKHKAISSSSHNQIELINNHHHHHLLNGDHPRQERDPYHLYHSERNGEFRSKRMRLDNNGMEIQDYIRHHSSNNGDQNTDSQESSAMQITPIRNLLRRSPSEDHHSPLPLELVTVTSSSPHRSSESGSPPSSLRRSVESDDLMNGFKLSNGTSPTIKITSIPVSGGCINITHDQSITGTSGPLQLLPIKSEPAN